jgi:hypothetical protein
MLFAIAACSESKRPGSGTGSGAGSGSASARPAIVTAERAEAFESYVVAFEKLTADIEHAGNDCKAALAVVERDTKELLVPLAARGDKLRDGMQVAKGDPAGAAWFATTYAARMKTSAMKLGPLETACGEDATLRQAVGEAMSQFPMMRKKPK